MNKKPCGCGLRLMLRIFNKKWRSCIICHLARKTLYFTELKKIIGISHKVLTENLQILKKVGIVERTVIDTVPIQVQYSLTDMGRSLIPIIRESHKWVNEWRDTLEMPSDRAPLCKYPKSKREKAWETF